MKTDEKCCRTCEWWKGHGIASEFPGQRAECLSPTGKAGISPPHRPKVWPPTFEWECCPVWEPKVEHAA